MNEKLDLIKEKIKSKIMSGFSIPIHIIIDSCGELMIDKNGVSEKISKPDIVIKCSSETFNDIVDEKLSPVTAYFMGRVKINGSPSALLALKSESQKMMRKESDVRKSEVKPLKETATKPFDVAVLGWWYGVNYGSTLTYYGLNRAIESLGYRVLMVHEALGYNGYRVQWPDDIMSVNFARRMGYNITEQEHYSKLGELNDAATTFVVGSDQLWNPLIGRVNDDLFLDFVSDDNTRVAYATSFGNRRTDKFNKKFVEKHSESLKKFQAISVREDYAINVAQSIFGVDAVETIDPVFLLSAKDYVTLAEKSNFQAQGEYLAVFFLDPTEQKKAVAETVAKKLGFQKIVVIPNPDRGRKKAKELFHEEKFTVLEEDAPEQFLGAYSHSSYVVTDSFHGTAFSIIFNKPFSSIYNVGRGADRFESLLHKFGFGESRRVYETDDLEAIEHNENVSVNVDFTEANTVWANARQMSLKWLKGAIDQRPAKKSALKPGFIRPVFAGTPDGFSIVNDDLGSHIDVKHGKAVRGNRVWCHLPYSLKKGTAYEITLDWDIRTAAKEVNLHIMCKKTGKFSVVGTIPVKPKGGNSRIDTVRFTCTSDDCDLLMIGAVHLTGPNGGAHIREFELREVNLSSGLTGDSAVDLTVRKVDSDVDLAIKDQKKYTFSQARGNAETKLSGARARMMFHAHAIEKGLSHSNIRLGFGKIAIPGLAREMNNWILNGGTEEDAFFKSACSTMKCYFRRHEELNFDTSEYKKLFNEPVMNLIWMAEDKFGGVLKAVDSREIHVDTPPKSFIDVIYGRRSVREFTEENVSDDEIKSAVQIAMQAPSVCNRQSARVHLIRNPDQIEAALKLQGGFNGYKAPPCLLLVTSNMSAFLFPTERNQAFIDGGLFMMNLLLGLEQVGLGSCCLNTAMGTAKETGVRELLGLPENEALIAFIAVGHHAADILTPRSLRIPVDEVLIS